MDTNTRPDPRAADVAEARSLFVAAEQHDVAPLPSLTARDLCVLGAPLQSLFDESVVRAWAAVPEPAREQHVVAALNGLRQRHLLEPPDDRHDPDPALRMHAPLATIIAARAAPAFLAICTGGQASRGGPRMYGIAEEGRGLRVVLVERTTTRRLNLDTGEVAELTFEEDIARHGDLNQIYEYLLVSPAEAARGLGAWLCTGDDYQVDLFHNREVGQFRRNTIRGREVHSRDAAAVLAMLGELIESGVSV